MKTQTRQPGLKGRGDSGGDGVAIALSVELLDHVLVVEPCVGPNAGPGGGDGLWQQVQAGGQVRQAPVDECS